MCTSEELINIVQTEIDYLIWFQGKLCNNDNDKLRFVKNTEDTLEKWY